MQHIVLIEPDHRHSQTIKEVVDELDGEFAVFQFASASDFYERIKEIRDAKANAETEAKTETKSDTEAEAKTGDEAKAEAKTKDENPTNPSAKSEEIELDIDEVRLVICDARAVTKIPIATWSRFLTLFGGGNTPAVRLLVTAFEKSDGSAPTEFLLPPVANVVLKPVDKLVMRENILLGLQEPGPIELEMLYSQEAETQVEIIKEVEAECLTELGFRTISSRQIEVGKIARYFGEIFSGGLKKSVFAYCYNSVLREDGRYTCSFSYIGIPSDQLAAIRRHINSSSAKSELPFAVDENAERKSRVLILSTQRSVVLSLRAFLSERFSDIEIFHIEHPTDLPLVLAKANESPVDVFFIDERDLSLELAQELKDSLNDWEDGREPKFIQLSNHALNTYEELKELDVFDDHFLQPLDYFYACRKLKMHIPSLQLKNSGDASRLGVPVHETIKTAMPVSIKCISEAHISIYYPRPIEVGKIRKFVLWTTSISEPPILGVCRHQQQVEEGKYQCDFLFFASSDEQQTHIRRWIRETYVIQKKNKTTESTKDN